MTMQPVVVVGAGLSGVACARELADAGHDVRLLDRGRRIGGRMASRRLADRAVDLGASYLTVTDPGFEAVVRDWQHRGLAAPWTETFTVLDAAEPASTKPGPVRWGAPHGLRSLVEDLARDLPVERLEVVSVVRDDAGLHVDGVPAAAVVLAMPDAQAARLLGPGLDDVAPHLDRASDPVIVTAAWWPRRTWDEVSPDGRFEAAFVNGDDVLAWVADDGRRRGDDAPVLVAHSTVEFAARHLDTPAHAGPPMVGALRDLLGVDEPDGTYVHRWSLAKPTGDRSAPYLLDGEPGSLLGVCGDGWGPTSKVETAWLSGRALGRRLTALLP